MSDVLERFRLNGRIALVTGGASGLGFEIAKALASAGASVAISSRDRAKAEENARGIPRAIGLAADVTDEGSVRELVGAVVNRFDRLDILVNNAGVTRRGPVESLSSADFDAVVGTCLKGTWLCSRAAIPEMRKGRWGRIVNLSSMFDTVALPNRTPYIAAKGGVMALTRALALEVAADGITVNAISPGPFATSMADAAARAGMLEDIPVGRWGDPAELGPAAVYLASDAAAFVTGTTLTIDGGYSAR